ncbi:MAG: hypothetical protein ABI165_13550 [Bryobacteraceae bacterium]
MTAKLKAAGNVLGRAPEQLTLEERSVLAGRWMALPIYTPEKLPLRKILAIGSTPADCARQLAAHGLDPSRFEFVLLR